MSRLERNICLYFEDRHIVVAEVLAGSRGRIRQGDIILSLNGATSWDAFVAQRQAHGKHTYRLVRPGVAGVIEVQCEYPEGTEPRWESVRFGEAEMRSLALRLIEGAVLVAQGPGARAGWLLSQRRTLARHLLAALRESRALRAELGEAQNRAAATALKLGAEIFDGEAIASDLRDQLDAMEQERNQLRLQLEESRLTNDRLIARLSKQSRTGRVTHIRLGNELFRNRTGARA